MRGIHEAYMRRPQTTVAVHQLSHAMVHLYLRSYYDALHHVHLAKGQEAWSCPSSPKGGDRQETGRRQAGDRPFPSDGRSNGEVGWFTSQSIFCNSPRPVANDWWFASC